MSLNKKEKNRLIASIIFDIIGLLSFTIPFVGEFSDIIWAPLSYFILTKMYKGTLGKASGIISFIEEAIPGTDFIPTFTITWFVEKYLINKIEKE